MKRPFELMAALIDATKREGEVVSLVVAFDVEHYRRHQTAAPAAAQAAFADWLRGFALELDKSAQARGGVDVAYRLWRAQFLTAPNHDPDCIHATTQIPTQGCAACEYAHNDWL